MKYDVLEEGWGELPNMQGAGSMTPRAPLEEEQSVIEEEPLSGEPIPPPLREQDLGAQPEWSNGTRELSLRQLEITGFLNPASLGTTKDRPTQDDWAANIGPDLSADVPTSRGSPRVGEVVLLQIGIEQDKPLETVQNVTDFPQYNQPNVGGDIKITTAYYQTRKGMCLQERWNVCQLWGYGPKTD